MICLGRSVALAALTTVSACAFNPNEEGAVIRDTINGIAYSVSYVNAAYVDTSGGFESDGVFISPFPSFSDGVLVTRSDGVGPAQSDQAAARELALRYCGRAKQVPDDPDGAILPNDAGWFFGECRAEPVDAPETADPL